MNGFEELHEYIQQYTDAGQWSRGEDIVRCRDCKYCTESMAWPGAYECDYINRGVEPDGFCAWGERKAVE